jgi:hypothetical protein
VVAGVEALHVELNVVLLELLDGLDLLLIAIWVPLHHQTHHLEQLVNRLQNGTVFFYAASVEGEDIAYLNSLPRLTDDSLGFKPEWKFKVKTLAAKVDWGFNSFVLHRLESWREDMAYWNSIRSLTDGANGVQTWVKFQVKTLAARGGLELDTAGSSSLLFSEKHIYQSETANYSNNTATQYKTLMENTLTAWRAFLV